MLFMIFYAQFFEMISKKQKIKKKKTNKMLMAVISNRHFFDKTKEKMK